MTKLIPSLLALAALGLAGCSTVESRIQEKSTAFQALSPQQQAEVREGRVNVGDSPDIVYIALGTPDRKETVRNTKGKSEVWTYTTYDTRYAGTIHQTYYRRAVMRDASGARYVVAVPYSTTQPVYVDKEVPLIRVTFAEGKVVEISESKS